MANSLSLLLHNGFPKLFSRKKTIDRQHSIESFDRLILNLALSTDINQSLAVELKEVQSYIQARLNADIFVLSPTAKRTQWLHAKHLVPNPTLLQNINKLLSPHSLNHSATFIQNSQALAFHIAAIHYSKHTSTLSQKTWLVLAFKQAKPSEEKIQFHLEKVVCALEEGLGAWHQQQAKVQETVDSIHASYAAELHDTLAQTLGYLRIKSCQLVQECKTMEHSAAMDVSEEVATQVKLAYRQVRDIITTSRTTLESDNLSTLINNAIKDFEQRSSIVFELDNRVSDHLTTSNDGQALYIIREALSNIVRHAHATHARVTIKKLDDGRLLIRIEDNGQGIQEKKRHDCFGLKIMHERAQKLSATLNVSQREGGGTRVDVSIPEVTS